MLQLSSKIFATAETDLQSRVAVNEVLQPKETNAKCDQNTFQHICIL